MNKIIKDTIHANGIDIGIYTSDFENEYISLTELDPGFFTSKPTGLISS